MTATSPPSPLRRVLGGILAGALLTFGFVAAPESAQADTAPPVAGVPETVAADALPTWQVTGVVWSQVAVGNTVYATGSFTKARPPGAVAGAATEINVANLIAYDITTGNRIASFNHSLNAQGFSISASPDGSRVYVGGDFTTVDGVVRQHLAAFDTATGALVPSFAPIVNGRVRAITATNTTVYAGGEFESAAGQVRRRLASFVAASGQINTWAPKADDGYPWSMTMTPDKSKVVVGGQFKTLNGVLANGMGAVDPVTGVSKPWAASSVITAYGGGAVDALTADANYIYGGAYSYGTGGRFEGSFSLNPNDGSIRWLADCLGDTYDVEPVGDVVYVASHSHNCLSIGAFPDTVPRTRYQHNTAFTNYATGVNKGPNTYGWNYGGQPAPTNLHFYPKMTVGLATGQYQASWSVVSGSGFVAMGGEFPTVNGRPQQGLTRFAVKSAAPDKIGPQYLDTAPVRDTAPTTAVSIAPGTIRVNFASAWDPDNQRLTYELYRDRGTGSEKLLTTFTADTNFWTVPTQLYTDTRVPPGSHTYQVKITDPFDNQLLSPVSAPVTAAVTSPYASQVILDGADHYWRLGDTGTTTYDSASTTDGKAGSGVTRGATGAISTDPDKASTFSGTSAGTIGMGTDFSEVQAPNTFTTEGWFKTTSTAGGKVLGYGTALVGDSGGNDRHVYLGNTGRVTFGVYPGTPKTISSAPGYNDGQWHMFTTQLSSAGMALYLDGQLIGRDATVTTGLNIKGWWRIGGDKTGTWPNAGTSGYLNGSIDDIATYPNVLTPAQISDHYAKRSAAVPANQPPVAAFTSSTNGFNVSFDASGSTDPDGTIASYGWDFGDQSTGTGATPSHAYTSAGTYPVKLTVTDNAGATGTKTVNVTVTAAPNVAPTANFTSSVSGQTANFDASSSTDPDGTIASYAWDFGDNTAAGSGKTSSHAYAANGTYSVKLTVTDNDGGTDTVTKSVTISGTTLARDTFNRTLATGWGSADVGGAWTYNGSTSLFAVGGNAGTIKMAAAGSGPSARLPISSTDTDLEFAFSFDKAPTGGGENVYSIVRGDQTNGYSAKILAKADNSMVVYLTRTVGGTETVVGSKVLTTVFAPGTKYTVRTQAWGSGTTNLRVKVWKSDTTEPAAWSSSITDATASLQSAGGIAVRAYLSGSATNAPVSLSVSNLTATPTGN